MSDHRHERDLDELPEGFVPFVLGWALFIIVLGVIAAVVLSAAS